MDREDARLTYGTILCPVDYSPSSQRAFARAVGFAQLHDATLTALHVLERTITDDELVHRGETASDEELLEQTLNAELDTLVQDGACSQELRERVRFEIRGGKPWVQTLKVAEELQADLIVMGTHGHSGFKLLIMGSQAERVVRGASCDVVCVKPRNFEGPVLT